MFRLALQRTRPSTIGTVPQPTDSPAETKHPHLVPHSPPAQGRAKRRSGWRSREPSPPRSGLSPNRPTRRPKRGSSTQCPTHPPTQGRAKRRSGWRSREPSPPRSGLSPNRPTPWPKRGPPAWYPTHSPTQGRAERCSGWHSREPGPPRSGLSPTTEPSTIQRSSAPRGTGRRGGGGGPATEGKASPVEACPGGERSRLGPRGGVGGGRVRR